MVSTAWGAAGASRIAQRCFAAGFPCIIFSGVLTTLQRDLLVSYYNRQDPNEIFVLVLTAAGGVGLDLKETKYVIILDVPWNPSTNDQAIARAIRYKSHASQNAVVNVYHLILQKPPKPFYKRWFPFVKQLPASDTIFEERIKRKTKERERITEILKEVSVEKKGESCLN